MKALLKNPFTLWLKWLWFKCSLERQHSGNALNIGYMAFLKTCKIGYSNKVYDHSILTNVELGDFTYVAADCFINNTKIGKFCSIGQDVKCGLGMHPSETFVSTHPVFYSTLRQCGTTFVKENKFDEYAPVEIGNDVWIGASAIIRDGVKIGDGAIVGAGSVVVSDVPAYGIVGGIPAKLIRYRFDQVVIDQLLALKWWDQDINWIKSKVECFCDIQDFLGQLASDKRISS
jgi:acetyltransferase-like isoleucine patch superfamily enzyme